MSGPPPEDWSCLTELARAVATCRGRLTKRRCWRGLDDQSGTAFVSGGTCTVGSSLVGGATYTVVIYAPRDCFDYMVAAKLSNAAGITTGGYKIVSHYGES